MSKKKKSQTSITTARMVASCERERNFAEKMRIKNSDNPIPFSDFLESLADLLIEIAEKNGTLSTPKRRPSNSKAA